MIPPPESDYGNYTLGLSLNLLKDFGPRVGHLPFKSAEYTVDLSRVSQLKATYDIISQLLSAYFGAIAAQKNLELNRSSAVANQKDLRIANALYAEGKIPRLSLLTLQAQNQQLYLQISQAERVARDAFRQLYVLAAVDKDLENLNIQTRLEGIPVGLFDEAIIKTLLKKKLDFNQSKNPDFLISKIGLDLLKISVTQSENNVYPSLALGYTYAGSATATTYTSFFPSQSRGNTFSLSLSMPIGFVTERHELTATRLGFLKAETAYTQLKLQLIRDWDFLVNSYNLLSNQLQILRDLAAAAKQKYEASLSTASLGSTYQQNIVTFQNQMVLAQTSLNQLEVDYVILQFKILSFHAHPEALEVFRKML